MQMQNVTHAPRSGTASATVFLSAFFLSLGLGVALTHLLG